MPTKDPAARIATARKRLTDAEERLMGARSDLRDAVQLAVYEQGWSWERIGAALSITRQAAHERFSR